MSQLRVARGFALPVDVAGEALAVLAKRGAGKTNMGRVLAEELVAAHVQTVVLDPVGAWWGLRSSADGKGEGLPVPILGGAHGDVPLESAAGALLADVVVESAQSVVLDLSDFSKGEQRRFATDFAERLYTRKARHRELLHVILEEADEFVPQGVRAAEARMVGAFEQLVRRGRGRGIGVTMITQRSAALNKAVLEQADVLVAMRTTGPRDRAAIEAWVAKQDVEGAGDVLPSLPGLETGEAWVWNPERSILRRVRIRLAHTFDSGATAKAGQARVAPRAAAAIDLTTLGEQIQATAVRAKQNDPVELRRRLRELERELEQREVRVASELEPVRVEVPVLTGEQTERLERAIAAVHEVQRSFLADTGKHVEAVRQAVDEIKLELGRVAAAGGFAATLGRAGVPKARGGTMVSSARLDASPVRKALRPVPTPEQEAGGPLELTGPERRVLDALAWYEALGIPTPGKVQVAFVAGYRVGKRVGGTYGNILGRLRSLGLIDYPAPSLVTLTAAGAGAARDPGIARTNEGAQQAVLARLTEPERRVLQNLIDVFPAALSKLELAEASGYQVAGRVGGTYGNILGRLRSLGLIDYPSPGEAVATEVLFPLGVAA